MNERRYYTDSYTTAFSATIVERMAEGDNTAVVLDQTFFYPTSGGQPHDLGTVGGQPVLDVRVRESDGAVVHVLAGSPAGEDVTAGIDWARRFDHMQQHTGQHILSQAFIQTAGAETVGFHLSDATVTIDLDSDAINDDVLAAAQALANTIVWQDRPVAVRFVTPEEAAELPLRKVPPTNGETLRLVDIVDFDLTACGGTHVARTGEVGLIKIIKKEQRGQKTRIEFRCGARALAHYQAAQDVVAQLTAHLTTGAGELATAVAALQENEKALRRQIKGLQADLLRYQAQELLAEAEQFSDLRLITAAVDAGDAGHLRALASALMESEKVLVLLGMSGDRAQFVFGRSAAAPGAMDELLRETLAQLGSRSGGGNAALAQGAAPDLTIDEVKAALRRARDLFVEQLARLG